MKGDDLRAHTITSAAVDVIGWIKDHLSEFPIPKDAKLFRPNQGGKGEVQEKSSQTAEDRGR